MAEHPIGVEIVTPEAALYAGPATALVSATSEGDLTVMAGHAETIGDVVPGVTKIEMVDGSLVDVIVHGGFLQITSGIGAAADLLPEVPETERTTRVTVLAGQAELLSDVDLAKVETEFAEAELRLEQLRAAVQGRGEDEGVREAEFELGQAQLHLNRAQLRKIAVSKRSSN